jgi:protein required for attachment to host cells
VRAEFGHGDFSRPSSRGRDAGTPMDAAGAEPAARRRDREEQSSVATDPVRQVEHQSYDTPFVADLAGALRRLADLPPSTGAPYLTLSLDWQPDGFRPNRRAGREYFDQNADEFLAGYPPHTPAHESLGGDLERIREYLDGEIDPGVQGLVVVACSANGVFEPLPLGVPVPSRMVAAPTPALRALAHVAEDAPPYAVLLADGREASLSVIDQARRERRVDVEGGAGGRSRDGSGTRSRSDTRSQEQADAFARTVAEETRRLIDAEHVGSLVLAGDERITTLLTDALHQSVRDRLVGAVRLDIRANERDVVEATLPLVERAERERETDAVGSLENGAGPGGGAVVGVEETLTALQAGQVLILVMNDDFRAAGWADFGLPLYGAGDPPSEHPAAGDPAAIVPVALDEELVRLAIQSDAAIEIVRTVVPVGAEEQAHIPDADDPTPRSESGRRLDALGGVGALLRFVLDADQSTAEL